MLKRIIAAAIVLAAIAILMPGRLFGQNTISPAVPHATNTPASLMYLPPSLDEALPQDVIKGDHHSLYSGHGISRLAHRLFVAKQSGQTPWIVVGNEDFYPYGNNSYYQLDSIAEHPWVSYDPSATHWPTYAVVLRNFNTKENEARLYWDPSESEMDLPGNFIVTLTPYELKKRNWFYRVFHPNQYGYKWVESKKDHGAVWWSAELVKKDEDGVTPFFVVWNAPYFE